MTSQRERARAPLYRGRITSRKNEHIALSHALARNVMRDFNVNQRTLNGPIEFSWIGNRPSPADKLAYFVSRISQALHTYCNGWGCWIDAAADPDSASLIHIQSDQRSALKLRVAARGVKIGAEKTAFSNRFAGTEILESLTRQIAAACFLRRAG
jgi:hypothetical protein